MGDRSGKTWRVSSGNVVRRARRHFLQRDSPAATKKATSTTKPIVSAVHDTPR